MLESSYILGPPCPSWLGVARLVGTAKDICVEFPRLGFDHQPDQHLINARIKLYLRTTVSQLAGCDAASRHSERYLC